MTKLIKISDLPEFKLSECLKTDEDVAQYLTMVLEEKDDAELIHALGHIIEIRGMTEVARACGLRREALSELLKSGSQVGFESIMRICKGLGVKLVATPAHV